MESGDCRGHPLGHMSPVTLHVTLLPGAGTWGLAGGPLTTCGRRALDAHHIDETRQPEVVAQTPSSLQELGQDTPPSVLWPKTLRHSRDSDLAKVAREGASPITTEATQRHQSLFPASNLSA